MALKDTKLDPNGYQMAIKKKKTKTAQQIGAQPPYPVCDAHELA